MNANDKPIPINVKPAKVQGEGAVSRTVAPSPAHTKPVHYLPVDVPQAGTVGATTALLSLREGDTPLSSAKLYATGLAAAKRVTNDHERQKRRNMPRDVEIVLFDAHIHNSRHLADLHIAAWKVAYRGVMPDAVIRNLSVRQFEDRWDDLLSNPLEGVFTLLAVATGGTLAGFVRGGRARDAAAPWRFELFALNVHPRYQRRGIGNLLANEAIYRMRDVGAGTVGAWVLDGNRSARWFFKRFGATIQARGQDQAGSLRLAKNGLWVGGCRRCITGWVCAAGPGGDMEKLFDAVGQ